MLIKNPKSKRVNPFRDIYDSKEYRNASNLITDFPFIIDLELTNACNLNCRMCSRQLMERDVGYMSREMFQKVLNECSTHSTPIRMSRWGEPFLHPHIIEFCKQIKEKELILHITNNGNVISESHMKGLIECGLDSIIFSMQGATAEEYEYMRRRGSYSKLYNNIMKLLELRGDEDKPFIRVSSTISERDSDESVQKFIDYWKNIVDAVGIGRTNMVRIDGKKPKWAKYSPCTEVYQKLSVDYDGKVSACCGDYDNLLTIGDLSEPYSSLSKIWDVNSKLTWIRNTLKEMNHKQFTLCKDCFHTYEEF